MSNFIRWTGENCIEITDFLESFDFGHKKGQLFIYLQKPILIVSLNHFLIKDDKGRLYTCASCTHPENCNADKIGLMMEKPIYEINFEIAELLGFDTLKSHSGLGHIYLDNDDKTRLDYCQNWNDLMPLVRRLDISFAPPLKEGGEFFAQQYLREENDFGVQVTDRKMQMALAKCCLLALKNKSGG